MLLLEHPQRLSTDIDIIVDIGTQVEAYIEKAAKIFPFVRYEEQERKQKNNIQKRHFKFTYESPVSGKELYVLLDVLYEKNYYERIVECKIQNELLITEPEFIMVKIPSLECVLGDKLTAFAPHTTGIPLGVGKDMEIMKQLYDLATLIDELDCFDEVKNTYHKIVQLEISYRGIGCSAKDCLRDVFETALCVVSRGKYNPDEYPFYVAGIRELRGHIYSENYSAEVAVGKAAKVAYIAFCLLVDEVFDRIKNYTEFIDEKITQKELIEVRYLRKVNPEAYAYMIKVDKLLGKIKG